MARPPRLGPYAPLAAGYYRDDAMLAAGPDAELLYCRGLAFSADASADGYITERQVILVGVGLSRLSKRVEALVREGLWDEVDGGYQVRSWLKWNRSTDEIGAARKLDRDRKATGKHADSSAIPDGIQTESVRIPAGLPPDSLKCSDSSKSVSRVTTLHDTSLQPDEPEPDGSATVNQRANRLATRYVELVPLSNHQGVAATIRKALNAGYRDAAVGAALKNLIANGRSVTADSLRIELEGPPRSNGQKLSGPARALALADTLANNLPEVPA